MLNCATLKTPIEMREPIVPKSVVSDYAFHFDAPERVTFTRQTKIAGWLLDRRGLPISGIRGIVRSILRRRSIFRARRKRSRPLIAAAYPDLPDAGQSGFLLVLELPAGPSEIRIEVQDNEKIWRTIFVTEVWAFPLAFIGRIGLPRVEQFLVTYLAQFFVRNRQNVATSIMSHSIAHPESSLNRTRLQTLADKPGSIQREIKTVHLFVTSKSNLFIREIAELLCAGFRAAGCETELLVDRIPTERTEEDKIQIVVTPHEFFNLFLRQKLSWEKIQRLTNHLFLLGTEQPDSEWFESNLLAAPYARAMLDIHLSGVAAYRARGLRCFHLPLGYDPLFEQRGLLVNCARDVDICLLAAMTDRREAFITANADFFAAHNCHLRLVPIGFAKTEETRSYLPAVKRNALLRRTKILLNVHYSDLPYFEWHRALIGLANRCCIITETCEGFAPFVPGKHFIMAKADHLTACCQYYLEHDDEREAIAGAAYDFMREHFTQKDHCRGFLRQIENAFSKDNANGQLACNLETNTAVPLGTEPLPDALTKRLSQKPMKLFVSALRDDLSNMFRQTGRKQMPARNGTKSTSLGATADPAASLSDIRRGYAERFDSQQKARQRGETIFQLLDNSHYDRSTPAISVVITLYNYPTYIQQCLKSLEDARTAAIPGEIEIVIVNDASTDDSLQHAIAWQRNSRHPIRIVNKRFNTGLADARNIGLELARAPYAFTMDADNMVFPCALEQLYATIVSHGSAAVYSMLCRFQDAPSDREGLLSYFDWDPQMLVERPYIDAMALFDRRQLIEIGGYDNELYKFGWFGWEDYELWLRIAQAKLPVSFLPNVLCLYRHHQTAMSNTTSLFKRELVAHLIKKYQALIELYPPKNRILGVDRLRFAQGLPTTSQNRKRAAVSTCAPGGPP